MAVVVVVAATVKALVRMTAVAVVEATAKVVAKAVVTAVAKVVAVIAPQLVDLAVVLRVSFPTVKTPVS